MPPLHHRGSDSFLHAYFANGALLVTVGLLSSDIAENFAFCSLAGSTLCRPDLLSACLPHPPPRIIGGVLLFGTALLDLSSLPDAPQLRLD